MDFDPLTSELVRADNVSAPFFPDRSYDGNRVLGQLKWDDEFEPYPSLFTYEGVRWGPGPYILGSTEYVVPGEPPGVLAVGYISETMLGTDDRAHRGGVWVWTRGHLRLGRPRQTSPVPE
jgi:hypothetical protein